MKNFEFYLQKNNNNILKAYEDLWKIWNDTYWTKNSKKYTINEIILMMNLWNMYTKQSFTIV